MYTYAYLSMHVHIHVLISSIASGLRTDLRCQFKEWFITGKKGAFENFADNLVF